MKLFFVFLSMIFCHIVDDYYLQGILASMKQKSWWETAGKMYKFDYIVALLMYSFSWSFMIMLPIYFSGLEYTNFIYILIFTINLIIHAMTDNLKANAKKINLVVDQLIHICQIVGTFLVFVSFYN